MMAEGHQQYSEIQAMPVDRLIELGAALQVYVLRKNALVTPH